jgi:hypothetical protein
MSLDFRKLLSLQDKGISLTRDPLAKLFRKILFDLGVNEFWANNRVRQYLEDPTNRIPNNPSARSSARGNLFKELASDRMTFNVLVKGLKFLGPLKASFAVTVQWTPSRSTTHVIEMPIASVLSTILGDQKELSLEEILPDGIGPDDYLPEGTDVSGITEHFGKRKVVHMLPKEAVVNAMNKLADIINEDGVIVEKVETA